MFCPVCGEVVSDNAVFCKKCGTNVDAAKVPTAMEPASTKTAAIDTVPAAVQAPMSRRKSKAPFIAAAIVLIAIVGIVAAGFATNWFGLMKQPVNLVASSSSGSASAGATSSASPASSSSLDAGQAKPNTDFVFDEVGALSSKEIEEWEAKAKALADKYNVGVYLLFNDSMGVNDPTPSQRNEFARDYFIEHKLGVGPDSDGIIFVVSLRTRDYVTVAKGKGVSALDKDIDAIESAIVAYLKFDDWNGAAKTYYELVGSALENYSNA